VLDGKELLLEPLLIATPDRRLRIENRGRIAVGDERSLELRSAWANVAWPLAGAPLVSSRQGTLELRGWDRVGFSADAVVTLPDLPEVAVAASGQADRTGIVVLQSSLEARAGTAEAEGFFGFGTGHPWRLDTRVKDLDLSAFREGLDSRLSFHVAGSGQGAGQDAAWAAHVGSIEGVARGQKLSGAGFLRYQLGHYDIERFAFRLGPARIEVNGHVGGETGLTASFEAPDLSGFLPELGGSLQAKLEARSVGTPVADGSNLRVDLAVRGRDLRYGEQRAAVLSADADIDVSDRESSWIRLRAAGMQVGGQDIASTRISLDGRAREHEVDFRVGAGEKAVSLVGEGRFDEGVYRLVATRIESEAPALHPYSLEAPMLVVIGADAARLEETCFVHAPRRICLRADWHRDAGWSATLATHAFPLEALRVDLPRSPGYRGLLDLDVAAAGKVDMPWTATTSATLREAWLEYVTPSGRQERVSLGVAHINLESLPERHRLTAAIDDTTAIQLRAEATMDRSPGVTLGESPLSGSLQFSTTRLGLLPLLVPDIDKAEGSLQARLTLSGVAAAPVLDGAVGLDGGLFEFYQTNLRLRDVSARVSLLDDGLRLQSSGKAGGGTFAANGQFAWRERQLHGQLTLKGDNLLLADVPEVRIEASPDLAFEFDGDEIGVRGSVTVPKARIEPRQLIGAVTASADERIVGIGEEQDDAAGYRVTSDMRLNLGRDVRLDAFGLNGRLEGSVVLQSRPDEVTTASGEFEIMDGKYQAYSKELDVDTGRMLFAGGPVSDPGIDLRASKKVPGYEVGVIARGRLRKPELSLFSDPSMPQSQIASLLLVGRRLDNLDSSSRQSLGGSTGDMAAEGGALLAGQLGRYIGIDEISLESQTATGSDASTGKDSSLVIGKFLSPRFYISYGISLSNAINTFKLRYTIGDRWIISGEAGKEASADIEYTIDR
jgi:translocation and assembly module TamB